MEEFTAGSPCHLTAGTLTWNHRHNRPCTHPSVDRSRSPFHRLPFSVLYVWHTEFVSAWKDLKCLSESTWKKDKSDPSNIHGTCCCFTAAYHTSVGTILATSNIHNTVNHSALARLQEKTCIRDQNDLQSRRNGERGCGEGKCISTCTTVRESITTFRQAVSNTHTHTHRSERHSSPLGE